MYNHKWRLRRSFTIQPPIIGKLFLDELPWMVTPKSGLLQAIDYYWNRYWSHNNYIKLIVCGSSASWIIKKIINNKGGLYNRVTRTLVLEPFLLDEAALFLSASGIKLNHKQVLDLYMVFGGIPHYLALIKKGQSAKQSIDEICFHKGGELINEFERLFNSLFKNASASKTNEGRGAQIDLLFDRDDDVITICEIKFNLKPFSIYPSHLKMRS